MAEEKKRDSIIGEKLYTPFHGRPVRVNVTGYDKWSHTMAARYTVAAENPDVGFLPPLMGRDLFRSKGVRECYISLEQKKISERLKEDEKELLDKIREVCRQDPPFAIGVVKAASEYIKTDK